MVIFAPVTSRVKIQHKTKYWIVNFPCDLEKHSSSNMPFSCRDQMRHPQYLRSTRRFYVPCFVVIILRKQNHIVEFPTQIFQIAAA